MYKSILITVLSLVSNLAAANTYDVQLGQSITLQSGDVALVRVGGAMSAVSCGGGIPVLPARQQFEVERWARFSQLFQDGPEISRQIQCSEFSAEPQIRQAIADAQNAARETCFAAGYSRCAPPMVNTEKFAFYVRGHRQGEYACAVLARMVGTN